MNPLTRKSVLYGAEQCVCHDRESEYGKPEDNFQTISNLWCDYLGKKHPNSNVNIDPHDVAIMMCLLKIARIASGRFKEDSYVDCAGYIAIAGEIASRIDE